MSQSISAEAHVQVNISIQRTQLPVVSATASSHAQPNLQGNAGGRGATKHTTANARISAMQTAHLSARVVEEDADRDAHQEANQARQGQGPGLSIADTCASRSEGGRSGARAIRCL
jgi:hypothetical protein